MKQNYFYGTLQELNWKNSLWSDAFLSYKLVWYQLSQFLLITLIKIHIRVCFNDNYWLARTPQGVARFLCCAVNTVSNWNSDGKLIFTAQPSQHIIFTQRGATAVNIVPLFVHSFPLLKSTRTLHYLKQESFLFCCWAEFIVSLFLLALQIKTENSNAVFQHFGTASARSETDKGNCVQSCLHPNLWWKSSERINICISIRTNNVDQTTLSIPNNIILRTR